MEFEQRADEPDYVIFGGAFDPPHEGHRLLLKQVLTRFPSAKILVIPGKVPAGVRGQHKTTSASFDQRLLMCELAFSKEIASGRVEISSIEAELPTPSYTIQTLRALDVRYPGKTWALVIGHDQLLQFAEWYEAREILKRASLIVADRGDNTDFGMAISEVATSLGLLIEAERADAWRWRNTSHFAYCLQGQLSAAASRVIRQSPKAALDQGWISGEVANYIESQRLYQP